MSIALQAKSRRVWRSWGRWVIGLQVNSAFVHFRGVPLYHDMVLFALHKHEMLGLQEIPAADCPLFQIKSSLLLYGRSWPNVWVNDLPNIRARCFISTSTVTTCFCSPATSCWETVPAKHDSHPPAQPSNHRAWGQWLQHTEQPNAIQLRTFDNETPTFPTKRTCCVWTKASGQRGASSIWQRNTFVRFKS